MIRIQKLESLGRVTERDTLQNQVDLASAARSLQFTVVQNARLHDLANPMALLSDEGVRLPAKTAALVTQKAAEHSLREDNIPEWLNTVWPRPMAVTGSVAAMRIGCQATHRLSSVLNGQVWFGPNVAVLPDVANC